MEKYIIRPDREMTILEALKEEGVIISADCGGHGKCGKCKVITDGREALACITKIESETEVEIPKESLLDNIYVENIQGQADTAFDVLVNAESCRSFFMCVDIGTTTIAAALIDDKGKIIASDGCMNSQRSFGADVISRIEAAESGALNELKNLVRDDVDMLKLRLAKSANISVAMIKKIYISANTVMEHFFMGYSVDGFAKAPYKAVRLDVIEDSEYELMPGLSPFVGADILSGIAACEMDRSDKLIALIDLGTNGEMALGNSEKILVTSTAAGPVFEGGGISCGMTACSGAISDVEISGLRVFYKTIDDIEPMGICGTGVVACAYELRKNGLIDKNGIFDDDYIDDGFPITSDIYITKDDIRNFQMAKSAIMAGFLTLCRSLNINTCDIDKLYIAGGFGKHLNIGKAAKIGLIAEELEDRCILIGNTSLEGALMRGRGELDDIRAKKIKGLCDEIILAEDEYFQEEYIRNMLF